MMLIMHAALTGFSGLVQLRRLLTASRNVAVVLLAVGSMVAQSRTPAASKAESRLAAAIDRTLVQGHSATLPPHVAHLLGISPQEREVSVKQFAEMGEPIRGFEVSSDHPNDVVLFTESRTKKESTFYLTSRRGSLRKVLSVVEGVGYDRRPTANDKAAFEKEKQRWVDRLALKPL
ncbi:MAG TPA: hypothetical protein VJQ54_11455 [Candidatus Sulfotelmatobacter sp.]|nr:hypothetical protein [Candidatus Sulfotelmatobacter sp.]